MTSVGNALRAVQTQANKLDWLWLRYAIYGGLLSSLGVTLGWLLWVAQQVLRNRHHRNDVVLAVVVGAVIGLLVEWLHHYRAVALKEAGLLPEGDEGEEELHIPSGLAPHYVAALRIGGFTLGALGIVCEHLAADLIRGVLLPFVTSLAMLFPIGVLFTLVFHDMSWKGSNAFQALIGRVFGGALLGLAAAGLTFGVRIALGTVGHGGASGWGGWWVLMGIGFMLASVNAQKPGSPLIGALIAMTLVLVICKFQAPLKDWTREEHQSGPVSIIAAAASAVIWATNDALAAPDLPQQSWREAEKQIFREETHQSQEETPAQPRWARGMCRWLGCSASLPAPAPRPAPDLLPVPSLLVPRASSTPPIDPRLFSQPRRARILTTEDIEALSSGRISLKKGTSLKTTPQSLKELLAQTPDPSQQIPEAVLPLRTDSGNARFEPTPNVPAVQYKHSVLGSQDNPRERLCADLQQGGGAGLVRSWLVMLCFSLGLGVAAPIEEHYRPASYEDSQTRRNDWVLATITLALIVLAVVLTRHFPQGLPG